jgi:CRP-like cAMP-binding protein
MSQETLALLRAQPLLRDLAEDHLSRLADIAATAGFDEGDFLLREGGEARALFLLSRGRVALEVHLPDRGPVRMETLGPGDALGLSWMFPPYRWQLDARAVEAGLALVLDAAALRDAMDKDPAFGYAVTKPLLAEVYTRLKRVRLQRLDLFKAEP